MMKAGNMDDSKIPFEAALDKTGFGLYNYLHTILTGMIIISFACVAYSSTILVPASACELGTTAAQQGMLAAAPLIGSIIGAFAWGYLGDTKGRKNMLLLSIVLAMVFNTAASLSVNWVMLMVFQFVATALSCGKHILSITLLSESVPLAKRNLVLLLVASIFLLSQGIMAALAIPIIPLEFSTPLPSLGIEWNSWRTLVLVYSVPSLLCLVCLLFLHDSPKFLLLKGEEEKALDILRSIHRINHGKSGGTFDVKGLIREQSANPLATTAAKDQILPLFKAPLLKYTIIMATLFIFQQVGSFVVWLPRIANQFVRIVETGDGQDLNLCGIIQEAVNTPDDPDAMPCALNVTALLMVLAVGAFQSAVNFIISLVINITGRRNMVMVVTLLVGGAGIITNLIPNAYGSAAAFAVFLLGIMVLGLYTAMAVALFPTHLRAMAVSLTVAMGRIGTFASIQILNYLLLNSCEVGFYVFASIFAASAIVASFLPDDRLILKPPPAPKQDGENVEKTDL